MGKSQSKSYDISTSPKKASHKRPKSSQQRESLLLNRDSQNLNQNSQVSDKPPVITNGEHSVKDQAETKTSEINGTAEISNLESSEKSKDNSETAESFVVIGDIQEDNQTTENLDTKTENTDELKDDTVKNNSDLNDNSSKEESDQIDKALEEYIESNKQEESVEKEVVPEESASNEEVSEDINKVETEIVESKQEVVIEDSDKEEVIQKEAVSQEEEVDTTGSQQEEIKEAPVDTEEDNQQAQITFEAEAENNQDTTEITEPIVSIEIKPVDTEEKPVVIEENPVDIEEKPVDPEENPVDTEEKPVDTEEKPEDTEEKPVDIEETAVEEEETVQFKTVIKLETTPPRSASSQANTREDTEQIVDPPPDIVPTTEPAIPVEEPSVPVSASVVSSEIPEDMSTIEAVVCEVNDLKDGEMREVDVGEGKALLVRENGEFFAVGNKCTHYGAPLAKGALCNGRVRCPWHGACFNVKSGDIEDFPGLDSLPKFEVTVADGKVKVKGDKELLSSSKVQRSMCKQSSANEESVIIIGGGPASVMCAETLRKEGFTGKVTIATQEKYLPYDRVKLSKAMDSSPDNIALRNGEFYKKNDIDIQFDKKATSVDRSNKTVIFDDGTLLSYTSLVIATGGKPRQLPIPGANFDNVCILRTPDDANRIATEATGKNVVIIGSSFIGMEVAAYMVTVAKSVSVLVRGKAPFENILGHKIGSLIKKFHEDAGVKFYFERGIKEFVGSDNKATEAVLSDDTKIPCDIAILGVGVVPATDFLKDSGINMTNRGFIPVNENMKTSIEDIYAAGDIVEFPLFSMDNQQVNVQHWQMAHAHGKAAALGILKKNEAIKSVPFFWTMMYKKSVRYTGYGMGYDDIVIHGDLTVPNFVAFYTKGDDVIAVATLGADPVASQVAEIMYSGQKILKSEIQNSADAVGEKFSKLSVS